MKKIVLILTLIVCSTQTIVAQKIYKKLQKQICNCLEKENGFVTESVVKKCIENEMIANFSEIMKAENVTDVENFDGEKIGFRIASDLTKECQVFRDYLDRNMAKNKVSLDEVEINPNLNCEALKNNNFYYIVESTDSLKPDTIYASISGDYYIERLNNGKTYSLLKCKWTSDCSFELEFISSNDPLKGAISDEGSKYKYNILEIKDQVVLLEGEWKDYKFRMEFFIVD